MSKRNLFSPLVFLLMLFMVGCARNELARIPIQKIGQFETEFSHPGGELDFWTDFDIEFAGEISTIYTIEIYQGEEQITTLVCDPFGVEESLMTRNVDLNGLLKVSFLALMDCVTVLPEGIYSASVDFLAVGDEVKIFRADLIFRQPQK